MDFKVNETWSDDSVFRRNNLNRSIFRDIFGELQNLSVLHRDIEGSVQVLSRINDSAALN
jgi:hypothetical protein